MLKAFVVLVGLTSASWAAGEQPGQGAQSPATTTAEVSPRAGQKATLVPANRRLRLRLAPSFQEVTFDRVVAFFIGGLDGYPILDDRGKLTPQARDPVVLTPSQARGLASLLRSQASHEGRGAACFDPHHAFVFLNRAGEVVAHVSVCFGCNNLVSAPRIIAEGSQAGFTIKARRQLQKVCRSLGYRRCHNSDNEYTEDPVE